MRILITGATGFVGTALVERLILESPFVVRGAVRHGHSKLPAAVEPVVVGDLATSPDWREAVTEVDTIVHLAARVQASRERAADSLAEFRSVNVESTLRLGRHAAEAGVKRFVFLSSVKVHGETGAFTEEDPPAPADVYAISKREAELGLADIAAETGMELVVVRPPLVYGARVKGNFRALMRSVARGIPLPLGAINNRRSFVALDNLVDFILTCTTHPAAAHDAFLVSDGEDLSITALLRRLAHAMDRPARLIPVPAPVLLAAAALIGKRDVASRLLESLQVDISKAQRVLAWTPPITVDEGLRRTVAVR